MLSQIYFFIAESAQMIMRNVNYEIPGLKRQIAKCQQIQRVSFVSFCFKTTAVYIVYSLGISGSNILSLFYNVLFSDVVFGNFSFIFGMFLVFF